MDGTEEAADSVAIGECRAIVDLEKPNARRGPGYLGRGLGVFVKICGDMLLDLIGSSW